MNEYSYFVKDIFGNSVLVSYEEFKRFFDVLSHTYPDFYCETHINSYNSRYEVKNYYHDGMIYCSVMRDLDFLPFS